MKKKKPLQNPVVVIALCAVAGAALYFNTIAPLLKGDEEYYIDEETGDIPEATGDVPEETVEAVAEAVVEDEELPLRSPVQSGIYPEKALPEKDSDTVSELYALQWQRKTNRNPFIHPEKRDMAETASKTDKAEQARVYKGSAAKKRKVVERSWKTVRNTTRTPEQPAIPLHAISLGPSGRFALIGFETVRMGDTCSVGVIAAIDRTSVTVRKSGKLQIITLKNRNRE